MQDYTAPELKMQYINGEVGASVTVDKSIDVYSLGCCFFFALTGSNLFKNGISNYALLQKMSEKWKIPITKNIIEMMVHKNPSERPTTKQILEHPFFWSNEKILQFIKNANEFLQGNKKSKIFQHFTRGNSILNGNWKGEIHDKIAEKCTGYNEFSAADLIRAIRNRVRIIFFLFNNCFNYF